MSRHVFHEICLHITWHTRDDEPLLRDDVQTAAYDYLRRRCAKTKGVFLHAVGGTENHVHLALSIQPFISISDLIGELKGSSAREINKRKKFKALNWQRGFGVVSFGKKNLPFVMDYIEKQKEHHTKRSLYERLERVFNEQTIAKRIEHTDLADDNG